MVQASDLTSRRGGENEAFTLSPQQVAYFETFGFLRIPGLFADDLAVIMKGFEDVFAREQPWITNEELHLEERRSIIPAFVQKSPDLAWLLDDHRVHGVVTSLMPGPYEYCESDGNLFDCESSWHPDTYSAPLTRFHVKLSFYLDPLTGENGAIRMIPGTNHHRTPYAKMLRRNLEHHAQIEEIYGVRYTEIPSWTLQNEPGDLIAWNFRTIHGSFNGGERRRLFSINFREIEQDGDTTG
jgi:ectoine hydroxylase-related dioxygenase (phytanoyl-CoA dioxygenase family)